MIRRATVDDAPRLAELAARTFHETFAVHNAPEDMEAYMSTAYSEAIQREELADPNRITLVIEEGKALIAYAQLRLMLPEIEIGRFYVDRPWHGRGIAQPMMNAIFDIARELHVSRIWLGVWERNPRAIAFYEKFGFRDCGSHPFLLGSDLQTDRLMELRLG
ncbi:MAG TPA: GNAT family N-acetyltransferase [Thermoanaerobaculia bacterium]|nr:GNAT family N-acetyltransferase [Thermoanaerobaculia bacterium]